MSSTDPSSSHSPLSMGPLGPWLPTRTERLIIQPSQAEWILEHCNTQNRNISKTHLDYISGSIKGGFWVVNGATIVFSKRGVLFDGQHRLRACVETDTPIETLVFFGADEDAFRRIDQTRKSRDFSDILAIECYSHARPLAATVKVITLWDRGHRTTEVVGGYVDIEVLRQKLIDNPDILSSVSMPYSGKKSLIAVPRIMFSCHYLFGRVSAGDRDRFFDSLASGANLNLGDPILALRQRLYTDSEVSGGRKSHFKRTGNDLAFSHFNLMVRAWNHWRSGIKISKLIIPSRKFGESIIMDKIPDIK
jgi:hypothetical protein